MIWAIDGTNLIHADWFAARKQAVFNFRKRLEMIADHFRPTRLIVAFDRPSFRHDLFAQYKSHRPEKQPDLLDVLVDAERAVLDLELDLAIHDGFEADDVLASIAHQSVYRARPQKCVLVSGDKDLRQCLVDGWVTSATKVRRVGTQPDVEWFSAKDFVAKYGLQPREWLDVQTLMGDPGDGVPGVEGVGEKTAVSWVYFASQRLKEFAAANGQPNAITPLAEIFRDPWSVECSAAMRSKLRAFAAGPWGLVRRLVELRTDVPLTCLEGLT